ncbi:ionotropic receptor 75a-like [Bradysia coprophila]|uniref:ionotropic receptor 75a-like n=1 Tax=Bradysia coprophila TaxID=38358 RepID=UPI00187D70E2|nr:ionotropic receptor 75a-like [Bradysia coprophila]
MVKVNVLILCYVIRSGFGMEYELSNRMVLTVRDLLIGLRYPLRISVMSCWNSDDTTMFIRNITSGPKNFQIKIINDANPIIPNMYERHQEVIIADLQCNDTIDTFSKISRSMFNFYKIIIFDGSVSMQTHSVLNMDTKIRHLFHNCPIMPMSQVFFISDSFAKNHFLVKQVYRLGMNEPLIIEDFPYPHVKTTDLTAVLRRQNFHGYQLRASMVILDNDSLNHLDDYRDIHIDAVSKVGYHLTNHVATIFLNATLKYSIVSTWGYQNATTGQWNGMVGELLRDEADIGSTALFFTPKRISLLEYISRSTSAVGGFLFQAPKLSYTSNIYALPFNRLLWICLFALVLVIAGFLCGAVLMELKVLRNYEAHYRLSDVYMTVCGALCQQGSPVAPNSVTGRLITAVAFLILMLVFVSYSANIVALLQSPSNQIKTIKDLYESKIDASVEDTIYFRHYFPLVTETLRKKFFDEKVCKDGKCKFVALEEGIKRVQEGQHAFHCDYAKAYKIISETFLDAEKCGLRGIPYFEMNLDTWSALPKNSSYKELIKIGMMRIQEHGLQQKENLRYYMTKPKCQGGGGNFVSVSLVDTGPAVILLGWGMGLTLVVFICEIVFAKFNVIRKKFNNFKKFLNRGPL